MIIKSPEAKDIPALRQLWQEAFQDTDAFLDGFFAAAFSTERSRCAVLEDGIASALYWFDCRCRGEKIAYLYAVATAKRHRGQGLCRALMESTHFSLRSMGYAGAVLVPAEGLMSFYAAMGYRVCGYVTEFTSTAAEKPVSLEKLDGSRFAKLRERYLPEGGVIQTGENLAFLGSFADFYAGEDFCLCGSVQNGVFSCQELLGNPQAAAGILKALNCSRGSFRIPGNGKPFAMYLPLSPAQPPAYFGLAMD